MANEGPGEKPPATTEPAAPSDAAALEGMAVAWRHVNDALRDSERRYRDLVEYSLGLICTHDLTGTILSINPAAAGSLGYQPLDGIGRNLRDFLSPDKRNLFDDYLRRMREHGRDEGLMSVQARTGDTRIWFYRNVLSQAPDGTPQVLGHAIDVTERVAAEQTLRRNQQALRAAQAELEQRVKERTQALETANQRLAFLAGVSERLAPVIAFEELLDVVRDLAVPFLGERALIHLVDDDGSFRPQNATDATHVGAPLSHFAHLTATNAVTVLDRQLLAAQPIAAGATLPAEAVAMMPLWMDGRVKAVVSLLSKNEDRYTGPGLLVLDDVARRVRLALDRIQLYREAQDANRLKDEFLATLSHELRTPLNAIYGWARILRGRNLETSTAHAVAVIERNAEAQIRLIEEVLDVSRIITGKMALARDILDVAGIARATIDVVRPALQAKRIRFEEHLGRVPPVVGDGHRLQQAFWNVLSNALKFTGADGTITAVLRSHAEKVEFEVSDTGVGIRREVLPFVFDRFRQGDSSMSRSHGGLGLGLAIVRHVVELHGGTVRVVSAGEGQGATFTIQLPAAQADLRDVPAPGPSETRGTAAASRLDGRAILVVEDHVDARELIAAVLDGAGARVFTASSVEEAIEAGRRMRPDAVVADLGLPGEDGYALLTRFQALHPGVPVIALTAYARSTDRERALAHGFRRYVIKPIDPTELVEEIRSVF